jgi:hypothetical protein
LTCSPTRTRLCGANGTCPKSDGFGELFSLSALRRATPFGFSTIIGPYRDGRGCYNSPGQAALRGLVGNSIRPQSPPDLPDRKEWRYARRSE